MSSPSGGDLTLRLRTRRISNCKRDGGKLANLYRDAGYQTSAPRGDIYQLFYERGCQLLMPSRGLLAYITSNSWLKAEYGKSTRRYFADNHTPVILLELGKDVFESAIVDSGVLMLRTGGPADVFPAVDMDRVGAQNFPPDAHSWGLVKPDGDEPWSILFPLRTERNGQDVGEGDPAQRLGRKNQSWSDYRIQQSLHNRRRH